MIKKMKNWSVTIEGVYAEDMKRFAEKAGSYGISAGELIGNFINDLVGGTASNGCDERDLVRQWFERCWFGMFPEYTFIYYLVDNDSLDTVLDAWEGIEQSKEFIRKSKEALADAEYAWTEIRTSKGVQIYSSRKEWEDEERNDIQYEQENIEGCKEILSDCWEDYVNYGTGNYQHGTFEEEMKKVLEWARKNKEFLAD